MDEQKLLERITVGPAIFSGKPVIRGMRISVELILSLLPRARHPSRSWTIIRTLSPNDIRACLAYAHAVIAHDRLDEVRVVGQ